MAPASSAVKLHLGEKNEQSWMVTVLRAAWESFLMYCCLLGQIVMDFCQLLLRRGFVFFHVAESTNVA